MTEPSAKLEFILRLYRCIIQLYPPQFRQEYESEMVQHFVTNWRAYRRTRCYWQLSRFLVHEFSDLFASAGEEWWRIWFLSDESQRSQPMIRPIDQRRPFVEEATTVMDRRPDYYRLFVTEIESLQSVGVVGDCLALDVDPANPAALFALFQDGAEGTLEATVPRWLTRLCAAVRQSLQDVSPGPSANLTKQLIQRIYADPILFELVAAEEVGHQLVDVVESLALDGNVDEIDEMLALMQELGDSTERQR